jgi:hypothetical protein
LVDVHFEELPTNGSSELDKKLAAREREKAKLELDRAVMRDELVVCPLLLSIPF